MTPHQLDDYANDIWSHVRDNAHSLDREIHVEKIKEVIVQAVAPETQRYADSQKRIGKMQKHIAATCKSLRAANREQRWYEAEDEAEDD